ncbi:MAG: c-type cytochrome domain-containing protein, partial [Fuerstiella sp.]
MNFSQMPLVIVVVLATRVAFGDDGAAGDVEFFEQRIRPVLIRHCYKCHSAASPDVKGDLRLDSRDLIRQGGKSGPAVVPGKTKKSLLLEAIRHESFEMPPDRKLSHKVIADFEKWIEIGAADPR